MKHMSTKFVCIRTAHSISNKYGAEPYLNKESNASVAIFFGKFSKFYD